MISSVLLSGLPSAAHVRPLIESHLHGDEWIQYAGTPLKPPLHAFHAYDLEVPNTRSTLSEALRTVLLHKRQLQEARHLELRAEEKAVALQGKQRESSRGGVPAAAGPGTAARVREMFGMGPPPDSATGGPATADTPGDPAGGAEAPSQDSGGASARHSESGRPSGVRGAAGSADAMLRAARAPKLASGGNWLTAMGSKSKQAKHRRVLTVDGEALKLPDGVSASQATGKLHFPVSFKFHEVRVRAALAAQLC